MINLPDDKVGCHHTGFAKKCRALVTSGKCNRWVQIIGTDANTGQPVNESRCVDNWTHTLMIENSQMQRQTGAAVESLRNLIVGPAERTPPDFKQIDGTPADQPKLEPPK